MSHNNQTVTFLLEDPVIPENPGRLICREWRQGPPELKSLSFA